EDGIRDRNVTGVQTCALPILDNVDVILTLPSLINFLLSGEKYNEFTHSSTTQLLNIKSQDWDQELIESIFNKKLPLAQIKQTNKIGRASCRERVKKRRDGVA